MHAYNHIYKFYMATEYHIVVLGSGGAGKSAITMRYLHNHFILQYDPTIEDSYRKQVVIDSDVCLLDILDTAGQEEFSALSSQWIRSGEGFIIAYTITDTKSLEEAREIQARTLRVKDADSVPTVIVGNKADLEDQRAVGTSEGADFAKSVGAAFFETSAKDDVNIHETFAALVRAMRDARAKAAGKDISKIKPKKRCAIL